MAEYIEREAAIKLREEFWKDHCDYMAVRVTNIMNIPAADVVDVRRGEWEQIVDLKTSQNRYQHTCGACGKSTFDDNRFNYPYCPNCGALMDGKGGAE